MCITFKLPLYELIQGREALEEVTNLLAVPLSLRVTHSNNRSSSTPLVEIGRKRERPMPATPYDWMAIQRLSDTVAHFNRFIIDILLWDLVRSYPDYIAYDRRGNEIGLAHLVSPPAYARQSKDNPWGTYGPVTVPASLYRSETGPAGHLYLTPAQHTLVQ